VAAEGQPSDRATMGVLTANGEGFLDINAYVGNIMFKGSGDLLVAEQTSIKIEGNAGEKTEPDRPTVLDFLNWSSTQNKRVPLTLPGVKNVPAKSPYVLYKGFDGKVTISENRFRVIIRGKLTDFSIFGVASVLLIGQGTYAVAKEGDSARVEGKWYVQSELEAQQPKGKKSRLVPPVGINVGDYQTNLYVRQKPVKPAAPAPAPVPAPTPAPNPEPPMKD